MKNTFKEINSRLDKAEHQISNLEDKVKKNNNNTQSEKEF